MSRLSKHLAVLSALVVSAVLASGCNTIEGAG